MEGINIKVKFNICKGITLTNISETLNMKYLGTEARKVINVLGNVITYGFAFFLDTNTGKKYVTMTASHTPDKVYDIFFTSEQLTKSNQTHTTVFDGGVTLLPL